MSNWSFGTGNFQLLAERKINQNKTEIVGGAIKVLLQTRLRLQISIHFTQKWQSNFILIEFFPFHVVTVDFLVFTDLTTCCIKSKYNELKIVLISIGQTANSLDPRFVHQNQTSNPSKKP